MLAIEKFVSKFSRLHVNKSNGAPAPHKPILLLSIIAEIEIGNIAENRIYITPELVARFKDYWHQLVHNPAFNSNFSLPFYHLKTDGFWFLHTFIGKEIVLTSSYSIKSFGQLKDVVDFASFDEILFQLLMSRQIRELLRNSLLNIYFNGTSISENNKTVIEISNQILNDPPAIYKTRAEYFDEEEVFVRGGVFKKEIPRIYNYTCCISGMRIIAGDAIQMIDACHIIPFSESHDDTIHNGISLCPNLHRAFDRYLIAIDENYKIIVKPFIEDVTSYSIRQFEGKEIALPKNMNHYPSLTNLTIHRERFNKCK
jgi:putative restriction endonuclease